MNGTSPVLMNQSRQPNEGLMRLIRETDDSLSVVDRAAKALYRQQVERLEREKEKELQIRIEAEKKAPRKGFGAESCHGVLDWEDR